MRSHPAYRYPTAPVASRSLESVVSKPFLVPILSFRSRPPWHPHHTRLAARSGCFCGISAGLCDAQRPLHAAAVHPTVTTARQPPSRVAGGFAGGRTTQSSGPKKATSLSSFTHLCHHVRPWSPHPAGSTRAPEEGCRPIPAEAIPKSPVSRNLEKNAMFFMHAPSYSSVGLYPMVWARQALDPDQRDPHGIQATVRITVLMSVRASL